MTEYYLKGLGAGMPVVEPNSAPFQKLVDVPDLIANGGLVDANGDTLVLPSTGFAAADILHVFHVPEGFKVNDVGVRVRTAEGASCTADIGCTSATATHLLTADADGMMGTINLNSATTQITLHDDVQLGKDNYEGIVFVTDGYISITFGSNNTDACKFDVWAEGCRVFPPA